jgi:fatty-acid desaturase
MFKIFKASAASLSTIQILSSLVTIAGIFYFEYTLNSWAIILLGYFLYSGVGVSMMMHRYWSHRSFEFKSTILMWICSWFAIVAGRGSPLGWVYVHRMHHKYADTLQDPHDANIVGWKIFFPHLMKYGESTSKRVVIDMLTKFHINIHNYYMWFIILWSLLLLVISPYIFYFFYVVPVAMSFIALDLFVLLSHTYGYRNFETKDASKNNWFISLILWGEGWHNNHHKNPGNFTTKIKWWEVDLTALVIKAIKK